ncbi:hypothetical protein HYV87_01735 [Candidatus Woesearchaeota archaeon]|nr:hypothetical protein [Candidatus Woesearchaeota archaeon]MBI2581834.1 hypothetical protein [Candidatus Woesearchaeota archaeon]
MKKVILGLVLAVSACQSLEERAIEITARECNNLSQHGAYITTDLDLPVDNEYLTPEEIAHVDNVLQEKTDCQLSVYLDKVRKERSFLIEKQHSALTVTSFEHPRYEKVYPIYK